MKNKMKLNIKSQNPYKIILSLSFATLILSLFAQMYLTNKLAVKGSELTDLENQKQELQRSISKLEFDNSVLSSLSNVETRAVALGFVKQSNGILAIKDPSTAVVLPSH